MANPPIVDDPNDPSTYDLSEWDGDLEAFFADAISLREVTCPECKGNGIVPRGLWATDFLYVTCPKCGGARRVFIDPGVSDE